MALDPLSLSIDQGGNRTDLTQAKIEQDNRFERPPYGLDRILFGNSMELRLMMTGCRSKDLPPTDHQILCAG